MKEYIERTYKVGELLEWTDYTNKSNRDIWKTFISTESDPSKSNGHQIRDGELFVYLGVEADGTIIRVKILTVGSGMVGWARLPWDNLPRKVVLNAP
jgi:hypothetical protein